MTPLRLGLPIGPSRPGSRAPVGVAIGATRLVAAVQGGHVVETAVEPDALLRDPRGALTAAFAELLRDDAARARPLAVALMPSLAEVRTLELPPMSVRDATRAVARDPGQWFAASRGRQVVAVAATPRRGRFVACAASTDLVAAVHAAAAAHGATVARIVPAVSAWLEGADAPAVLVVDERETTIVASARGAVVGLHTCRTGNAPRAAALLREAGVSTPVVIGPADAAAAIVDAARSAGDDVRPARRLTDPVMAVAARHAARAGLLRLVDEPRRRVREARVRRAVLVAGAATAALVAAAAASTLAAERRALADAVQARAALRPVVAAGLARVTRHDSATARAAALRDRAGAATPWEERIAVLAAALPDEAHLTSLRAAGDSVLLTGQGANAAAVLLAMRQVPAVRGVRATSPFRQDLGIDGTPVEHFSLAVTFAPRAGAP